MTGNAVTFPSARPAGSTDGLARTLNYTLARVILGKDFISPEEIAHSRKYIVYTSDQLAQFGDTVPSQEVMEWCRENGYMLVAGPNRPLSLLDVCDLRNDYFYSKKGGWYARQEFARNDKVETRWIILRKEPVPGSARKTWGEQQALLEDEETVPNAAEVVWCITTYKAVRNVYLLPSICVRTSSISSDGDRVYVGDFDAHGLGVSGYWDGHRNSDLGVSSSRKF